MEENNTGGWCAPSLEEAMRLSHPEFLSFPTVGMHRGGIMFPMPALDTTIMTIRKERRWRAGCYYVWLRQYGEGKVVKIGPFTKYMQARNVETELYAWYSKVYNVIIRMYRETERIKK